MNKDKLQLLPGILFTFAITMIAMWIHKLPFPPFTIDAVRPHPIDTILLAVLLGMLIRSFFTLPKMFSTGIKYSVKSLLPFAIILLGAKLDFFNILKVSTQALFINVVCVTVALGLTYGLCVKAGIRRRLGLLIGIGTAICGGTAIVVAAPIIEAEEEDITLSVATITLFGTAAIFIFPALGHLFNLTQIEFGIWAGTAVHATPQVLAAGYSYGEEAGDIATIVKLVRVLMLAPFVMGLSYFYAKHKRSQNSTYIEQKFNFFKLFPPFILGFILFALAKSFAFLPEITLHLQQNFLWEAGPHRIDPGKTLASFAGILITMAMAGVGLATDIRSLAKTGLKPLYVGMFAAVVLSGFSYGLIKLFF